MHTTVLICISHECVSVLINPDPFLSLNLKSPPTTCTYKQQQASHSGQVFSLLLEYLPGGSLKQALVRQLLSPNRRIITWQDKLRWTRDLASGMAFLASQSILHRDLKPDNILLDNTDFSQARLKICDLGLAKLASSASSLHPSPERVGGAGVGAGGKAGSYIEEEGGDRSHRGSRKERQSSIMSRKSRGSSRLWEGEGDGEGAGSGSSLHRRSKGRSSKCPTPPPRQAFTLEASSAAATAAPVHKSGYSSGPTAGGASGGVDAGEAGAGPLETPRKGGGEAAAAHTASPAPGTAGLTPGTPTTLTPAIATPDHHPKSLLKSRRPQLPPLTIPGGLPPAAAAAVAAPARAHPGPVPLLAPLPPHPPGTSMVRRGSSGTSKKLGAIYAGITSKITSKLASVLSRSRQGDLAHPTLHNKVRRGNILHKRYVHVLRIHVSISRKGNRVCAEKKKSSSCHEPQVVVDPSTPLSSSKFNLI
jgi:hypothetical protein